MERAASLLPVLQGAPEAMEKLHPRSIPTIPVSQAPALPRPPRPPQPPSRASGGGESSGSAAGAGIPMIQHFPRCSSIPGSGCGRMRIPNPGSRTRRSPLAAGAQRFPAPHPEP
ncbi:hypothetical protein Nmel_017804, partial [Mimus melanotis]